MTSATKCPVCDGAGMIVYFEQSTGTSDPYRITCWRCKGSGRKWWKDRVMVNNNTSVMKKRVNIEEVREKAGYIVNTLRILHQESRPTENHADTASYYNCWNFVQRDAEAMQYAVEKMHHEIDALCDENEKLHLKNQTYKTFIVQLGLMEEFLEWMECDLMSDTEGAKDGNE